MKKLLSILIGMLALATGLFAPTTVRADSLNFDFSKSGPSNEDDRKLARQIRQSISEDVFLSKRAKKVRVVCHNGHVRLRGSVSTENEKTSIEAKAIDFAGIKNVKSFIKVK